MKLALALGGVLVIAGAAFGQGTIDELTCFKVKDRTARSAFDTTLGDPVAGTHCTVKTPAKLGCLATSGTTMSPAPPGSAQGTVSQSVLCYQARCRRPLPGRMTFEDASGRRTIGFQPAQWVCLPATVTGGPPTTTPIATTTTTMASAACEFKDGKCTGSCGKGMTCGAVAATGSCECRSVACGDASTPECNGACSNPRDACVFTLTGCSCVAIP